MKYCWPTWNSILHLKYILMLPKVQIGAVISQKGKPIAFYLQNMNSAQQNYTTTEKELLSVVSSLKEFRNILLRHQIKVYTYHKNLTYNFFNTERVMRWRLILKEFGPELKDIKGEHNAIVDALSCLEISDNQEILNIYELYVYDDTDLPDSAYPIHYHNISKAQKNDAKLNQKLVSHKDYPLGTFRGGDQSYRLIFRNRKICLPAALQKKTVDWYHQMLYHPGETQTEHTLHQNFDCKGLRTTIHDVCKKFPTCQISKKTNQKYGKLPPKQAETNPWDTLCVDLIGPYTIPRKGKNQLKIWCLTMIDPDTDWSDMAQIPNKMAA